MNTPRAKRVLNTERLVVIQDDQIRQIESAYGRKFSASIWQDIRQATLVYQVYALCEAGPSIKGLLSMLANLQTAAAIIKQQLSDGPTKRRSSIEEISKAYFEGGPKFRGEHDFADMMVHCVDAAICVSKFAATNLQSSEAHRSRPAGAAWSIWIVNLATILSEANVRVTARKDSGASPFVKFIAELQKTLPEQFRNGMPKESATDQSIYLGRLAQAISRARRAVEPNQFGQLAMNEALGTLTSKRR